MSEAGACVECLRRSWLLSLLGPYLEKTATGSVGKRSPELLRLSNEDLLAAVAPNAAKEMIARVEALDEGWFAERLADAQCWSLCRHDERFPLGPRDAGDGPWALIGRGDPTLLERLEPQEAVTIVGSRRATSYGREVAIGLARELSSAGLIVISGLAFGIDACAHRGALDEGGKTIAVLGCGPDTAYPAQHRSLWRRCVETGAVVSELPPGSTPWRWSFPARNRVMAALAGMTVVVEAAARSGSLITADLAADLGRDLGAVPGPVISRSGAGPNGLLAEGACVVRQAQDVLDAMAASAHEGPPTTGEASSASRTQAPGPRPPLGLGATLTAEHRDRKTSLRRAGWPVERMNPEQILVAHEALTLRRTEEGGGAAPAGERAFRVDMSWRGEGAYLFAHHPDAEAFADALGRGEERSPVGVEGATLIAPGQADQLITRERMAALEEAGCAGVAEDLRDGVPLETIDARLRAGGNTDQAVAMIGRWMEIDRDRPPRSGLQEPAYTVVGCYGEERIPYVTTVRTQGGPEEALGLGREAFRDEGAGDLELRIVALFHDAPRLVDFDIPSGERD